MFCEITRLADRSSELINAWDVRMGFIEGCIRGSKITMVFRYAERDASRSNCATAGWSAWLLTRFSDFRNERAAKATKARIRNGSRARAAIHDFHLRFSISVAARWKIPWSFDRADSVCKRTCACRPSSSSLSFSRDDSLANDKVPSLCRLSRWKTLDYSKNS